MAAEWELKHNFFLQKYLGYNQGWVWLHSVGDFAIKLPRAKIMQSNPTWG